MRRPSTAESDENSAENVVIIECTAETRLIKKMAPQLRPFPLVGCISPELLYTSGQRLAFKLTSLARRGTPVCESGLTKSMNAVCEYTQREVGCV
jgi:hypothetical protein